MQPKYFYSYTYDASGNLEALAHINLQSNRVRELFNDQNLSPGV
jgi:hypothetical protein